MTTRSSTTKSTAPAKGDVKVTPEEARVKDTAPVNIETETPSPEPLPAPKATPSEKIQTDIREKLSNRSVEGNAFVPANPASLEKAAGEVAQDQGFNLNRGTSIGARLMARAQKRV